MPIISADVPRAVIDAGILAATYPGHVPARWALPLLDQLEERASGWRLIELDAAAMAALWLPPHGGEACHGDSMSLVNEGGSCLSDAHDWLIVHAREYAAANPSCWARISHAATAPMSPLVVSAAGVGDRLKPDEVELVVVDGLHRALGFWMAGQRQCQAYAPVLVEGTAGT